MERGPKREGRVDFTVSQDPCGQWFLPVSLAWMWLERGIEMKDLEWGVSIRDERSIEFAAQRRLWEEPLDWEFETHGHLQ